MDYHGRIIKILNSSHPNPDELINKPIHSLFLDGFGRSFNGKLNQVTINGKPQRFMFFIHCDGTLQVHWCRIIKDGVGFMLISEAAMLIK